MDSGICIDGIVLITFTDFCEPEAFTLLELDGAICYTRIFLETVLKEAHERVVINVFIKEKSDAIFKDSGGFTERIAHGRFNIVIFKDIRKKMIATLSHELVHVKQFLEDGFLIDQPNNMVYWDNREYMKLSELVSMHREKMHELYALLPWEHDANLTLLAIVEMVTDRFEALIKDDPGLQAFLQKAMRESDYNMA